MSVPSVTRGHLPRHRSHSPWVIVAAGSLGPFVGQLDASVVQVALPSLGTAFDRSINSIAVVSLAYLLAFAAPLPLFDRLSERYGRRSMFMAGAAVETTGLVLCATAPSLQLLVVFRVIQGLGASVVGANNLAIITSGLDDTLRTRALGVFASAQAMGLTIGLGVGGPLISAFGWRAAFWVTAPFAAAKVVGGWLLPDTPRGDTPSAFDIRSAVQLVVAMVGFMVAVNGLAELTRPRVWAPFVAAVVAVVLFVRRSRTVEVPLLNPAVFALRSYSSGLIGFALLYGALAGVLVLDSFALQRTVGDGPARAGLQLAALALALTVAATISHGLIRRFGAVRAVRGASAVGALALCALMGICYAGIHRWGTPSSVGLRIGVLASLAVLGTAFGVLIPANNVATLAGIPRASSGQAASWLNVARVYGSSLGVALAASALTADQAIVTGSLPHWLDLSGAPLLQSVLGGLVVVLVLLLAGAALTTEPGRHRSSRAALDPDPVRPG